jgi:hypothetical protein
MITKGGDFSKLPDSIPKRKITCYVKEAHPYFLVADDFFYIPCYFTKKAVDDFRAKNPSVKITDLKLRVIELSNWSLEMVKVNSADVFTSYGGLELRLIVKEFNLNQKQGVQRVKQGDLQRYPVNIYRDDEIKTLFQRYTHDALSSAVKAGINKESLPDVSKKTSVSSGVVKFNSGDNFSSWKFKEGKTAVVSIESIYAAEKGTKKAAGSSGKAKVVSKTAVSKRKVAKSGTGAIANQISRYSGNIGKKSITKKSG